MGEVKGPKLTVRLPHFDSEHKNFLTWVTRLMAHVSAMRFNKAAQASAEADSPGKEEGAIASGGRSSE